MANGNGSFNPEDKWAQRAIALGRLTVSTIGIVSLAYLLWSCLQDSAAQRREFLQLLEKAHTATVEAYKEAGR